MATHVEVEEVPKAIAPRAQAQGPRADRGDRSALVMVGPIAASLVAIAVHWFVPNAQVTRPSGCYPVLLGAILAASVLAGIVQWAWARARKWTRDHAPLLAAFVLAICGWDLITLKWNWLLLPYFPGPDQVLLGLWDDRAMLLDSTYHSLKLLLSGYAVGVAGGLGSGILIGWSRSARYWGMPVLKLIGPIPATAFLPLAMTIFSDAFLSGTMLVAMAVWFPVTMLTSSGIANVPASYFDVARTLGANRRYLIFRVAVPAALPSIFIGLFVGLCTSFLTLVVAETVGAKSGLGWYLKWQQGYVEYAKVYAALIIMAVFFSGLMTVLFRIRDRVLGWQKGVIRW